MEWTEPFGPRLLPLLRQLPLVTLRTHRQRSAKKASSNVFLGKAAVSPGTYAGMIGRRAFSFGEGENYRMQVLACAV